MHIAQLSLTNVRSFRRLDVDLTPGLHVVTGPNGSGKSNLLESIALLATARSLRTSNDVDLIAWEALRDDPLPGARLAARVQSRAEGNVQLEVTISARPATTPDAPVTASRRFRVNGVARRASDLIGRLRVVLFSAEDLAIIEGAPATRRRYLDITISQIDPGYVRALQRYQRVLQQRNSLLRRIQEHRSQPAELDFWDEELSQTGAVLLTARHRVLRALHAGASQRYEALSTRAEQLEVVHRPGVPPELAASLDATPAEVASRLLAALVESRRRDALTGTTRYGPHRDDVAFLVGGHTAASAASRGELRGMALALRLAEVTLSTEATGDPPVLLLDDVLSELDAERRQRVLAAAFEVDQVVITSPDPDRPARSELSAAHRYRVADGALVPVEP
ncbi:MAG: DNA replication/repair protein RecF [Dehalococcoidia bacterium]